MYFYHSNYILLVFNINYILMSWQDAAFKMWVYSLKNIHAQENDQQLRKHRYLIAENIKCGFFFQWQSYHNNVIILRNWIWSLTVLLKRINMELSFLLCCLSEAQWTSLFFIFLKIQVIHEYIHTYIYCSLLDYCLKSSGS